MLVSPYFLRIPFYSIRVLTGSARSRLPNMAPLKGQTKFQNSQDMHLPRVCELLQSMYTTSTLNFHE